MRSAWSCLSRRISALQARIDRARLVSGDLVQTDLRLHRGGLDVGKASRKRAEARAKRLDGDRISKRQMRAALAADSRGRLVGATILEYVTASRRGPMAVKEALIYRHNVRMSRCGQELPHRARAILSSISLLPALRIELDRLGANRARLPGAPVGPWPDQIAWGLDGVAASVRLLSSGQLIGAAVLARAQLERWTINLAFSIGVERTDGERASDFTRRTWLAAATRVNDAGASEGYEHAVVGDELDDVGEDQTTTKGFVPLEPMRRVDPGLILSRMSEVVHGRALTSASRWEAQTLGDPADWEADCGEGVDLVLDALSLVMMRLRACLWNLTKDKNPQAAALLMDFPLRGAAGAAPFPGPALWPINDLMVRNAQLTDDLKIASEWFVGVEAGDRPLGRLFRDDEMVQLAFLDHRYRAFNCAMQAFEHEQQLLGELNWANLRGRENAVVLTAELLALLSGWLGEQKAADAAAAASSALRSAYWLWLEDDDRAMSALRCVLEQTARMRTWLTKPKRAAALEARPQSAPRDWLDRAGWARLSTLNRALGELSHVRRDSKWVGAVERLAELQPGEKLESDAIFTARGFALRMVLHLAAREAQDAVTAIDGNLGPVVAEMFDLYGVVTAETDRQLEQWLQRNQTLRSVPVRAGATFTQRQSE